MTKRRCATCAATFWTFGGLMKHVARSHPRGVESCEPGKHRLVRGRPGESICTRCGDFWESA